MDYTERQKDILTTALGILAREGSGALTMKRVAEGVGFTEAALYRHFEGKRSMLLALYDFVRRNLIESLSPVLALQAPPPERLRVFLHGTVDFLLENRGVNLVLLAESIQQRDDDLREAMLAIFMGFKTLLETLLQAGVATGHFRPDLDSDVAATCIAGTIQGCLTRLILSGDDPRRFDMGAAKKSLVEFALGGVVERLQERDGAS